MKANQNPPERQLDALIPNRARFVSFVRSRVGDRVQAEDIVQTAFARVLEQPPALTGDAVTRWFYRVLRNAIVDRHRRTSAEARGLERWQHDPTARVESVGERRKFCGCVRSALDRLAPKSRAVLEAIELRGLTPAGYAAAEGISPGNAAVRLHRARRLLADGLKRICGTCTLDSCADCDCHDSG